MRETNFFFARLSRVLSGISTTAYTKGKYFTQIWAKTARMSCKKRAHYIHTSHQCILECLCEVWWWFPPNIIIIIWSADNCTCAHTSIYFVCFRTENVTLKTLKWFKFSRIESICHFRLQTNDADGLISTKNSINWTAVLMRLWHGGRSFNYLNIRALTETMKFQFFLTAFYVAMVVSWKTRTKFGVTTHTCISV